MRSDLVVLLAPPLDQYLRFLERVEDLAVQELVAKLAVERVWARIATLVMLSHGTRREERRLL